MEEKFVYVMSYGTLKRGFYNHSWMEDTNGEYVDDVVSKDSCYKMVGVGESFPGIVSGNKKIFW